MSGGTAVSISAGLNEYSLSDSYLMIGLENKSACYAVYVDGQKQSTTTSGSTITGGKYTFVRVNVSSVSLIEVYKTSDNFPFKYDLYTDITDPEGHISSITTTQGYTYTAPWRSSYKFAYGEKFTVNSDKAALDGYSITGKNNTVTNSGTTYSFTPFPSTNANEPKFTIEIPDENHLAEYKFHASITNSLKEDQIQDYVAGYQRICPHNSNEPKIDDFRFDERGTCDSKFHDGDTFILLCWADPENTTLMLDGNQLTNYETKEENGNTYYAYNITPIADGYLNVTFDLDNQGGGSTTESTYTIHIKADRNDAVMANVYRNNTLVSSTPLTTSYTDVTAYQETGYITVSLTDTNDYAFTGCTDENKSENLMQYDEQTTPVTIRATVTTGESSGFETDGHNFLVSTKDVSNLQKFDMNIDIVDNPANVVIKHGAYKDINNSMLRTYTGLTEGTQTIQYTEDDTFLLITSDDFTKPLYDVSYAGTIEKTDGIPPVYVVSVDKANTQGGTITITANKPEVAGSMSFTLDVDHVQYIDKIRRYENSEDWLGTEIILDKIHDGQNTITYNEGEFFRIYPKSDVTPESVTNDGTDVEFTLGVFYEITPASGKTVVVRFGDVQEVVLSKFTVLTDLPAQVYSVVNSNRLNEKHDVDESVTVIEFRDGDEFVLNLGNRDPKSVTFGTAEKPRELSITNGTYNFFPFDGGYLIISYDKEVEVPVETKTFTINVDDASMTNGITEYLTEDYDEEGNEYTLENGTNEIPVGTGYFCLHVSQKAAKATKNGNDLKYMSKSYSFEAAEGDVVVLKFATNPKYTLIVDDPTKVAEYKNATSGASLLDGIATGSNVLEYLDGQSFSFTPAEGVTPLAVIMGEEELEPTDGTYTYAPADGDVVKVFFNHVPDGDNLVAVKARMVNPGTEGVLNNIWIGDGAPWREDCDIFFGGVLVDKGTEVGFNYRNHEYHINSITVNGVEKENTGAFYFNANKDTEVVFDVTAPTVINYTVNIQNSKDVVIYYGNVLNENTIAEFRLNEYNQSGAQQTAFQFTTNSLRPQISIAPVGEILINSVSDNLNNEYSADESSVYSINLTDGMIINIETEKVTNTEMLIVCIDIHEGDFEGMADSGKLIGIKSGRTYELKNGRNVVEFNSRYDGGFRYGFSTMPLNIYTYLNEDEIKTSDELLNNFYIINPASGDILRTYCYNDPLTDEDGEPLTDEDGNLVYPEVEEDFELPEKHEVEFTIHEDLAGGTTEEPMILVKREDIQDVDTDNGSQEYAGTRYFVYVHESFGEPVQVTFVAAEPTEPAPTSTRRKAPEAEIIDHKTPEGYKYVTDFTIDQPGTINIAKGTTTGIEDVVAADKNCSGIYSLQGILIKADATAADLRKLPAGLYIFNGRKVIVK